jgi:hypothetical protein
MKKQERCIQRSVKNINRYPTLKKNPEGEAEVQTSEDEKEESAVAPDPEPPRQETSVGTLVVVVDEPDDTKYWIAEIMGYEEGNLSLHYYGSRQANLAKAKFQPVWIETSSNRMIMGHLKGGEKGTKWMGLIENTPEFVKATDIRLKKSKGLTAATLQRLRKLSLKHHVV